MYILSKPKLQRKVKWNTTATWHKQYDHPSNFKSIKQLNFNRREKNRIQHIVKYLTCKLKYLNITLHKGIIIQTDRQTREEKKRQWKLARESEFNTVIKELKFYWAHS